MRTTDSLSILLPGKVKVLEVSASITLCGCGLKAYVLIEGPAISSRSTC